MQVFTNNYCLYRRNKASSKCRQLKPCKHVRFATDTYVGLLIRDWYRIIPGVKRPGRGINQPPPSGAEVKERVEL